MNNYHWDWLLGSLADVAAEDHGVAVAAGVVDVADVVVDDDCGAAVAVAAGPKDTCSSSHTPWPVMRMILSR